MAKKKEFSGKEAPDRGAVLEREHFTPVLQEAVKNAMEAKHDPRAIINGVINAYSNMLVVLLGRQSEIGGKNVTSPGRPPQEFCIIGLKPVGNVCEIAEWFSPVDICSSETHR